ncbi:MAG: N-acetylmuramic acid 6-phosphate etherase [Pseudorhodobacter sp.]
MTSPTTEDRHPAAAGLHRRTDAEVLACLHAAQTAGLGALRPALPMLARVAGAAADVLRKGGRLGYAGAGSSGLMALADCLELAGTFGIPPDRTPMLFAGGAGALLHMRGDVEDDPRLARADLAHSGLEAGDMVLVLSASGRTPYALTVAEGARSSGVLVAGFANVAGSPLLALADFPVLVETGPEVVAGSTRMAAATAQKVALNMVSALIGVHLGHVHDGLMVNLVADNAKLVDRAARIVMDLAGVSRGDAETALGLTGGAVKPAVLVARGMTPEAATGILEKTGGCLPE